MTLREFGRVLFGVVIVLVVIALANRIPFTRGLVQAALR